MAGSAGTLTRSGTFVWEELITSDVDAAKSFYGAVLGWNFEDHEMPDGGRYVMFGPGEHRIGGLFSRDGMPSTFTSYVGVDSADEASARATELGAEILGGPFDVPEMGRMSIVKDPTGAVLQAWQPIGDEGEPAPAVHGSVAWHELRTSDIDAAVQFYGEWLGWRSEASDMGEMTYHVFHKGEQQVAGGMQLFGDMQGAPPHWAVTFLVDDVDATHRLALEHGATTQMEPTDLPDVGRWGSVVDPQGVVFGFMRWAQERSS